MTSTQSEVRALLDSRSEAMRIKDLDRVMALYSPDVVYFDLVPPLRYTGAAALRARFADWFGRWQSAIGQELRDLSVLADGNVAAAHMLVRVSNGCRREGHRWLITHEHVSLPVDLQRGGSAAMDLVP
jgi:ketosteroid isomerase-like protein